MIESLAEHGVLAADLVPALMTTHTVRNPEYDPAAARTINEEPESDEEVVQDKIAMPRQSQDAPLPDQDPSIAKSPLALSGTDPFGDSEEAEEAPPPPYEAPKPSRRMSKKKNVNPFGDDSDLDDGDISGTPSRPKKDVTAAGGRSEPAYPPIEEGDIANTLEDLVLGKSGPDEPPSARSEQEQKSIAEERAAPMPPENTAKPTNAAEVVQRGIREEGPKQSEALPGVSTALSKTDENVTLDIRWTVVSPVCRAIHPDTSC